MRGQFAGGFQGSPAGMGMGMPGGFGGPGAMGQKCYSCGRPGRFKSRPSRLAAVLRTRTYTSGHIARMCPAAGPGRGGFGGFGGRGGFGGAQFGARPPRPTTNPDGTPVKC
jgi:hypothetical protein